MDAQDKTTQQEFPNMVPSGTLYTQTPVITEGTDTPLPVPIVGGPDSQESKKQPSTSPFKDSLHRLRRDYRAVASVTVILFFVVLALIGPPIYQRIGQPYKSTATGNTVGPAKYHTFSHQELDRLDEGPSAQYWLGTDSLGRDIFARLMQGLLISLSVAILVEVVDIVLGISIGVLAGYYGGWIDQLLARFTDIMFAFPGLLFVILLAGIFGSWADTTLDKIPILGENGNARLLLVSLGLSFAIWPSMARIVRGQTLQLKQQQYIEAARTAGTKNISIIVRHIVPNLFSIVVVTSTLNISGTIIGEAALSLLGLGVRTPGSSLGLMISNGASVMSVYPWEILLPTGVLALFVLAFSFLGDGLRDAFDPRTKD